MQTAPSPRIQGKCILEELPGLLAQLQAALTHVYGPRRTATSRSMIGPCGCYVSTVQ
jgi:hypothetical protein